MKKLKITGLLIILIIINISCEELKDPAGSRGTAIVPSVSVPNPGFLINGDEDSYIRFEVNIPDGKKPDKTEVVVSRGTNFERVKVADITTFPATITLTLGSIMDATGATSINAGDIVYVEVEVTLGGIVTRSSASLSVPVVCAFDPALTVGQYRAVSPTWPADGTVTLTADPADPYKIYVSGIAELDGLTEDRGPLVMHIDPATLKVTADKSILASEAFGYHDLAYQSANPGNFNTCDGKYTMYFTISVFEGTFAGVWPFTFTRK